MKQIRISRKAKLILIPLFSVGLVLFAAFMGHMIAHGGAAFPGGKIADGRYLVQEHGRVVEFTRGSFLLSYYLGVASTVSIFAFLLAVFRFYWTGDLSDEAKPG